MQETFIGGFMHKYHKDAPFQDPLVRCYHCRRLMKTEDLTRNGRCGCGSHRVRNVLNMSRDEFEWAEAHNIDPEFLDLFEETHQDEMMGP